jgi:hypothetical protein
MACCPGLMAVNNLGGAEVMGWFSDPEQRRTVMMLWLDATFVSAEQDELPHGRTRWNILSEVLRSMSHDFQYVCAALQRYVDRAHEQAGLGSYEIQAWFSDPDKKRAVMLLYVQAKSAVVEQGGRLDLRWNTASRVMRSMWHDFQFICESLQNFAKFLQDFACRDLDSDGDDSTLE